jgi:hypothetical protein
MTEDSWELMADTRVCRKCSQKENENRPQSKWKISVVLSLNEKGLLIYFVQDFSLGRPDYDPHEAFVGDCELVPPFLIMLLVSNRLTDEVISVIL